MSQSNTASQQLYDLLVARDFDPEALDASGKPAADPGRADISQDTHLLRNRGAIVPPLCYLLCGVGFKHLYGSRVSAGAQARI